MHMKRGAFLSLLCSCKSGCGRRLSRTHAWCVWAKRIRWWHAHLLVLSEWVRFVGWLVIRRSALCQQHDSRLDPTSIVIDHRDLSRFYCERCEQNVLLVLSDTLSCSLLFITYNVIFTKSKKKVRFTAFCLFFLEMKGICKEIWLKYSSRIGCPKWMCQAW